jgi:hypothetical protein
MFYKSTSQPAAKNIYMNRGHEKSMPQENNNAHSEETFKKLLDCGYSEKITEVIWQWYHPKYKKKKNAN